MKEHLEANIIDRGVSAKHLRCSPEQCPHDWTCRAFRSLLLCGPVFTGVIPAGIPKHVEGTAILPLEGSTRLEVHHLLRLVAKLKLPRPCLVLTTYDLHVRGRFSVFGYAKKRSSIAVVSLSRIADPTNEENTRRRLENEIAHELGHLNGWRHCSGACVMRPVRAATELDRRPLSPCGGCPRACGPHLVRYSVAALLFVLFLALADRSLSALYPPFDAPFHCWVTDCHGRCSLTGAGADDRVSIYFEGRRLLTLRDRGAGQSLRDRSVSAVLVLNRLAHSHQPETIIVSRTETGLYGLAVNGRTPFLPVLTRDIPAGGSASQVAAHWADALNSSVRTYAHRH